MGYLVRDVVARVIAPAPEACYRLLTESRDVGRFWRGMHSELVGPFPWGAGTRLSFRSRLGRPAWLAEVKEAIPAHLIEIYYVGGDFTGAEAWEFEPVGEGTRVAHIWRGVEPATIMGRALSSTLGARLHQLLFGEAIRGMERSLRAPAG
jgi:hypothetical protein